MPRQADKSGQRGEGSVHAEDHSRIHLVSADTTSEDQARLSFQVPWDSAPAVLKHGRRPVQTLGHQNNVRPHLLEQMTQLHLSLSIPGEFWRHVELSHASAKGLLTEHHGLSGI